MPNALSVPSMIKDSPALNLTTTPGWTVSRAGGHLPFSIGAPGAWLLSPSVLVTGGAGFIGSALACRLVEASYDVAVMDVLHPQVHAGHTAIDLPPSVRLFTGDVTHAPDWDAVLRLFRPSQIVHLAAETGTAQSLTQAARHGSVNVVGTAQLLDALSRSALVPEQVILASSRAVYGEGAWQCGNNVFYPPPRSHAQLLAGVWNPGAVSRLAAP